MRTREFTTEIFQPLLEKRPNTKELKFMFSKKATKIDEIFIQFDYILSN